MKHSYTQHKTTAFKIDPAARESSVQAGNAY
jgi:hypothetical protein